VGADEVGRRVLGERVLRALRMILWSQHPSGEMLSYRRDQDGRYVQCRSPFVSAFVHDALAPFDPDSPGWVDGSLDVLPPAARDGCTRVVADARRRIRQFLAWQQEAAGNWRFFGRGSGIDPDVATTASAAVALLESYGAQQLERWERQVATVQAFRADSGPYYTFVRRGRGAYGWTDDAGRPLVGFDRVVNVEVLRYLCRAGLRTEPGTVWLADWLRRHMVDDRLEHGTSLFPDPLYFFYAVGRAWAQGNLPGREEVALRLVPALLGLQRGTGEFGGPLSTALGAMALLYLGETGPALDRARLAVLRGLEPQAERPYDDFAVKGTGSPAWAASLSVAFLAQELCRPGGRAA
jgi:hypothetical protein